MKRQVLTDGSGEWFDIDRAKKFNGKDSFLDENNRPVHEWLYRTACKKWIVRRMRPGGQETWIKIDDNEAAAWLVRNNKEHLVQKERGVTKIKTYSVQLDEGQKEKLEEVQGGWLYTDAIVRLLELAIRIPEGAEIDGVDPEDEIMIKLLQDRNTQAALLLGVKGIAHTLGYQLEELSFFEIKSN